MSHGPKRRTYSPRDPIMLTSVDHLEPYDGPSRSVILQKGKTSEARLKLQLSTGNDFDHFFG